jgi:antirestriction protein ArdC
MGRSRRFQRGFPHKPRRETSPSLVAELGSAFLCGSLGIAPQPRPDHAGYIAHWLDIMKADKRAIFTAAAKASEAVKFIRELEESA